VRGRDEVMLQCMVYIVRRWQDTREALSNGRCGDYGTNYIQFLSCFSC